MRNRRSGRDHAWVGSLEQSGVRAIGAEVAGQAGPVSDAAAGRMGGRRGRAGGEMAVAPDEADGAKNDAGKLCDRN